MQVRANCNGPFRVGVVGCGRIAIGSHLPFLVKSPDVQLAWITDANCDAAKKAARMYGVHSLPIEDFRERLHEIDVCLIAIPYGARANYLRLCADHAVSVYVEKPIARTVSEHKELEASFVRSKIAIGFQRRFFGSVGIVKQILKTRVFGDLRSVDVSFQAYSLKTGGSYITNSSIAGGGITIEVAIHLLDLLTYLLESKGVYTNSVVGLHELGIDYHVESRHELIGDNRVVPVSCVFSLLRNGPKEIVLSFDNAAVSIGMSPQASVSIKPRGFYSSFALTSHCIEPRSSALSSSEAFGFAWQEFLESIRGTSDCRILSMHSLLTTAWIESIYDELLNA